MSAAMNHLLNLHKSYSDKDLIDLDAVQSYLIKKYNTLMFPRLVEKTANIPTNITSMLELRITSSRKKSADVKQPVADCLSEEEDCIIVEPNTRNSAYISFPHFEDDEEEELGVVSAGLVEPCTRRMSKCLELMFTSPNENCSKKDIGSYLSQDQHDHFPAHNSH
ncbi:hypothetical protein K493DRAFT_301835 [Basidiobolus meristosporus CBS 931.73]|uniref:Uncharacterized protein n=1 Tax=Basidiobolus meristosporus CBS 931.73 TaxID=1314790 RepID=A0A1Y1YB00_9FUNG|nr:hypothetical protein K493DRAFT_301835 [Basidiobolus meristosporus CBS 931.73]|eukprot:ORX94794.1 hypothetical protein K493DRAFT_301835 [Basidiobolus meristosporus CBS 931.73]